jgi:L-histidine N-alpha-methyltransferase
MLEDVALGLGRSPKELPAKYFYDARGSELFEEITRLPEYYLTRAEKSLLHTIASPLAERVRPRTLIELGPGGGGKNRILLTAMEAAGRAQAYVPLDVSETYLATISDDLLRHFPGLRVIPTICDVSTELLVPPGLPEPRLFAFLGSTIGNFDHAEAEALLARVAGQMHAHDAFLLGFDLRKDIGMIEAAYNDSRGVTAEFNRNMLYAINAELDADFQPEAFEHLAFYNRALHRIEMHLVARTTQRVTIPGAGTYEVQAGESIRTEISCKYDHAAIEQLFNAAGLRVAQWHTSTGALFGLALGVRASVPGTA